MRGVFPQFKEDRRGASRRIEYVHIYVSSDLKYPITTCLFSLPIAFPNLLRSAPSWTCTMPTEEISLSIEETNALRLKLGLKPLRVDNDGSGGQEGGKSGDGKGIEFRDLKREADEETKRKADEDLKRKVKQSRERRMALKEEREEVQRRERELGGSASDWVKAMRSRQRDVDYDDNNDDNDYNNNNDNAKGKRRGRGQTTEEYTDEHLRGIRVAHKSSDFEVGEGAILTLDDDEVLERGENGMVTGVSTSTGTLVNADIKGDEKRRKMEMERRKAKGGGYLGYDDDEFEELGGAGASSRGVLSKYDDDTSRGFRGFTIGEVEKDDAMDVDGGDRGVPVSLQRDYAVADDFMSKEEAEALKPKKKRKKEKEFKKSKRSKKSKTERVVAGAGDDEEEAPVVIVRPADKRPSVLEQMEAAQVESGGAAVTGSVRRSDADAMAKGRREAEERRRKEREERFERAMNKGTERSKMNGGLEDAPSETGAGAGDDQGVDEALKKAERLARLRAMRDKKKEKTNVAELVSRAEATKAEVEKGEGGMTISFDGTAEFARGITVGGEESAADEVKDVNGGSMMEVEEMARNVKSEEEMKEMLEGMEEGEEIAEGVGDAVGSQDAEEDAGAAALGPANVAISRGAAAFIGMLKATGDLGGNRGGREEMRGRANDSKTYEDYAPTDLGSVVRIDKRRAKTKDLQYAKKEVKLEYRDEHGRLLTRKEAFRQLCYQFHGYGSGKRAEEKRLKQIEKEREAREKRINEDKGTMGALRKTQEATGKAFIVHRT